jgi:hypothetical protein
MFVHRSSSVCGSCVAPATGADTTELGVAACSRHECCQCAESVCRCEEATDPRMLHGAVCVAGHSWNVLINQQLYSLIKSSGAVNILPVAALNPPSSGVAP